MEEYWYMRYQLLVIFIIYGLVSLVKMEGFCLQDFN